MIGGPTAGSEALLLGGGGTGDTDGYIQFCFGLCLEQERNHNHDKGMPLAPPSPNLSAPKFPDTRMKNRFELMEGGRIGKDTAGHFVAAQPAIRPGNLRAEGGQDLRQGRLPKLNDLARQVVGIHDRNPARVK